MDQKRAAEFRKMANYLQGGMRAQTLLELEATPRVLAGFYILLAEEKNAAMEPKKGKRR